MMTKLVYLFFILTIAFAQDFNFNIKIPSNLFKQNSVSANQKLLETKILGVTEFEYFNNLLQKSLPARVRISYNPNNLSYGLYIEDSVQGIDYTLLIELSGNQAASFIKNLQHYSQGQQQNYPINYENIKMFFDYKNEWYQQKDNQFVLNVDKNASTEYLQLIVRKIFGASYRLDNNEKPYLWEQTYDPSIFYISKPVAAKVVELMVSSNLQ